MSRIPAPSPVDVGDLHLGGRVRVCHGDSRDVLKAFPDGYFHAVVCDPPYALVSIVKRFGGANAAPAKEGTDGAYKRASAGFMGRKWDTGETAFAVEFWAEVWRVLKPGGFVIAASGTRTYHRLACAVEDAGFEIRDMLSMLMQSDTAVTRFMDSLDDEQRQAFTRCIDESQFGGMLSWLYGSGFPKSHDVAKGIAKRRVEDVEPTRIICRFIRAAMDDAGLKSRDLTQFFGDCNPRLIDHWAARDTDSQPGLPTADQWGTLVDVLNLTGRDGFEVVSKEWARLDGRKGEHSDEWTGAEVIGEQDGVPGGFGDHRFTVRDNLVRTVEGDAADWQGWGTALKPACEPWVFARKPLIGSVAANVLAHGTGGLNIDGCRVGDEEITAKITSLAAAHGGKFGSDEARDARRGLPVLGEVTRVGRWPANVIHDGSDEVVSAFPETASGVPGVMRKGVNEGSAYGAESRAPGTPMTGFGDSGSAARFFYTAKADGEDRFASKHPTVKPVNLMQYLVRLVTPKGGVVLDPFAGSGTTGEAAWREGMHAVLIEREADYVEDIRRRMRFADSGPDERQRERIKASGKAQSHDDLPLFAK